MATSKQPFDVLNAINVNEHIEKKKTGSAELSYLSWTWAWAEAKKHYPNLQYEVHMFDGKPYMYDEATGYMCFTSVTIEGVTHTMWLPVMDGNNRAMKAHDYQIAFKSGKSITVAAATMFDINKTIMRCLVKNLAMFGLGLYIYAGEDLPEAEVEELAAKAEEEAKAKAEAAAKLEADLAEKIESTKKAIMDAGIDPAFVCRLYKIDSFSELTVTRCDNILKNIDKIKAKQEEKNNE
jgi:hypothetical protein